MPDYMILLRENEGEQQRIAPAETRALVEGHAAYVNSLKAAGAYRDSERLRPSAEGKRVNARQVEPGPFGARRGDACARGAGPARRCIVDRGGRAVVQDPATAESPVMPHAAQRSVPEASVVPLTGIAQALVRMTSPEHARVAGSAQ